MAEIVEVLGVTHSPFLPRKMQREPGRCEDVREGFEQYRHKLAEAAPDVIVVVGSDHLNQWFMDNMAPFLVGKSPRTNGPFATEQSVFGLPSYGVDIDREFANEMIEAGYESGVDLAYSEEFTIDHSFTVPMGLLRPEMDIPIVPLFTNVLAPPYPRARRFFEVGSALRRAIDGLSDDTRVAVVGSGHLSIEVGGPQMPDFSKGAPRPDPEFDAEAMELLGSGKAEELIEFASPSRMHRAGNVTSGFLNFVLLAGIAGGSTPVDAVVRDTQPFIAWGRGT